MSNDTLARPQLISDGRLAEAAVVAVMANVSKMVMHRIVHLRERQDFLPRICFFDNRAGLPDDAAGAIHQDQPLNSA
ncbi:hypothetical protein [Sphingomonas mollis]|uniref:hypothetical protein n=1 Tax=Sphingomonas mollis TaxID=2795726 RepID=UPI001E4BFA8D|nr:hypothetical protein [Sphingomonas sp. BT553]